MINTLIIEDEAPAAARLEKLLKDVDVSIHVLDKLESVSAAIHWFENNPQPDLLMLDIQLADGLSFDIFKSVSIDSFVIFTTAYDEYAIKAFELNSIDYLLKPVDIEKLQHALEKYRRMQSMQHTIDVEAVIMAMERGKKRYKERFAVNVGTRIRSIEADRIAYFYSLEKNTFLCTMEGRNYPLDHALDKLEELLDPAVFFRISRQYIVNYHAIDKISVLSRSRVVIHTKPSTEEPLMVSTARTHQFRLWLDR